MNDKASATAKIEAVEVVKAVVEQPETIFGNDELGQVQQLLFGDHARRTNDRIDTLEKALLGALSDLSTQMTNDIAAVGKRIDAEAGNHSKATKNLTARFDKDIDAGVQSNARLKAELDDAFERLTAALDSVSSDVRLQIEAVRSDMTSAIDTAQSELEERKVDRGALAALLSATASKLE